MQIRVHLIGAFRLGRFKEKLVESPDGTRVEEIFDQLQIARRALGTVLINGSHAGLDAVLRDGDTLAFLPILGGG